MSDAITLIEIVVIATVVLVPMFVFLERDTTPKSYEAQKKLYKDVYGIKEKKNNKYWHFKI